MRGSIAIWHENFPIEAEGYEPRAEVHINIWRNNNRTKENHFDLFDIGFRFDESRALRSLSISLPFVVEPVNVSDLFERMHNTSTLSAIFNETLSPSDISDDKNHFAAFHTESKGVQFFVWRCQNEDLLFSSTSEGGDQGTIVTISEELFNRFRSRVGDHYIRLRFKVPIDAKNGFVSSNDPKDSAFLSTISTNEIVEFRLNERRNFSNAVRVQFQEPNFGLLDISAVHYFLIRDMSVELTQSHTNFRKMRRLEPEMWDQYLTGCPGFNPDEMIIYHWATLASTAKSSVESFTALATFRAYYTGSLVVYGLVIVALGAFGSAVQSLCATILTSIFTAAEMPWGAILANAALILVLILGLWSAVRFRRQRS